MNNHHKNRNFNEALDYNVSTRELLHVHNLFENNEQNFLEQAVCADGLTEASVQFLRDQSVKLWHEYALQLLKSASKKCAEDEGKLDATKTFIFGVYQHDREENS